MDGTSGATRTMVGVGVSWVVAGVRARLAVTDGLYPATAAVLALLRDEARA